MTHQRLFLVLFFLTLSFGSAAASETLVLKSQSQPVLFAKSANEILPLELSASVLPLNPVVADETSSESKHKSSFLAFVYSFLLPGMGELYAGRFDAGQYSLGVEAGLVTALIGTWVYAASLKSDYKNYAHIYAGVNVNGKSDQYFLDISSWGNIDEFNTYSLQQRDAASVYDPQTSYWNWQSDAARQKYSSILNASNNAYQSISLVVALMGVNHLYSAVSAALMVNKYNSQLDAQSGLFHNINVSPELYTKSWKADGLGIRLVKGF